MNIRFGIPKIEKPVNPLDKIPVLTMELVENKGFNRRFMLNSKAIEVLGINPGDDSVSFAFDDVNKKVYIAKLTGEDSVLVGKNKAFSNKKYYEYIAKMKSLISDYNNYFELVNPIDISGITAYELVHIQMDVVETTETNPIVDKEIEHLVERKEEFGNVAPLIVEYQPLGDVW